MGILLSCLISEITFAKFLVWTMSEAQVSQGLQGTSGHPAPARVWSRKPHPAWPVWGRDARRPHGGINKQRGSREQRTRPSGERRGGAGGNNHCPGNRGVSWHSVNTTDNTLTSGSVKGKEREKTIRQDGVEWLKVARQAHRHTHTFIGTVQKLVRHIWGETSPPSHKKVII